MAELDLDEMLISTEAARFLKISSQKLNRLRDKGIIQGRQLNSGDNARLFAYKLADLRAISPEILKPQKRGPKQKKEKP